MGQWIVVVVALVAAGGAVISAWLNRRSAQDATAVTKAASTVERNVAEFGIIKDTLDAVVEDQKRTRDLLAACRGNERLLRDWISDRHPGEEIPELLV